VAHLKRKLHLEGGREKKDYHPKKKDYKSRPFIGISTPLERKRKKKRETFMEGGIWHC